ncbi:MAG: PspA/IM30 family protein [Candidatus Obscuribacterales bacterium]|jgi:phage shock protein A|nr:PspA/IM30 family protein [Cyanobacteria bacterium SZAS LIN-5]RTL42470.1 MAG: PspA/IM30 family protein [Candidatus Melainabacteria bacterium]
MFERLGNLFRAMFNAILGKMEDPQIMLEQTYQDLQSNLIQVRQAVAQAIATEKQLEQQLQKNKDQAETWQNRAAMAVQQGNDDLAKQALQRRQQYVQAATDLETQLKSQRESTVTLRQRLTDLEAEVQKAYTKKQVLIARDKAAQATSKANEILSKTTSSGAMSVIEKMETKVQEREAKAAALAELSTDSLDKQFKNFEGKSDVEMELLALKQSMGKADNKISVKEPVLIETKGDGDITVDAKYVKEEDEV